MLHTSILGIIVNRIHFGKNLERIHTISLSNSIENYYGTTIKVLFIKGWNLTESVQIISESHVPTCPIEYCRSALKWRAVTEGSLLKVRSVYTGVVLKLRSMTLIHTSFSCFVYRSKDILATGRGGL
jgi:hypothetical protein